MFKNYLKITLRNLFRHKAYSVINIAGLAIGISACILIYLYVQHELSYDSHFEKADRTFKVANVVNLSGQTDRFGMTAHALAPRLQEEFPELEAVTKVMPLPKQTLWVQDEQHAFNDDKLAYADSVFFNVFNYRFLAGDAATALNRPRTIVLTEAFAEKLFGSAEAAMGQVVRFTKNLHVVTGVIRDEGHSHMQFSALLSMVTLPKELTDKLEDQWLNMGTYTYVVLPDAGQQQAFEAKLQAFTDKYVNPYLKETKLNATVRFSLQPIRSIHLSNDFAYEWTPPGNANYVYIFSFVALFILLIACINYMNLSTARSAKRAREVGLRKVSGAYKSQLIWQFLGESVFTTVISVVFALALVELLLPVFNQLTGKSFDSAFLLNAQFLLALLAIILLVGVLAGSYPAFFLSGFKPVDVLKSDKNPRGSSALLRKALVVTQFTLSLIMIIGTVVVFKQMQFLKNTDLGFNKEQVLVIDIPGGDSTLVNSLPQVKHELLQNPKIKQVATTEHIPGQEVARLLFRLDKDGQRQEKAMDVMFVDEDFFDLMRMQLTKGRGFSKDMATDEQNALIINEAAANWLGWNEPEGNKLIFGKDQQASVIGVVKDFHFKSLHTGIEPLVIMKISKNSGYLLARLEPQDVSSTLAFIEEKWQAFDPKHPMEYFFLDEKFDEQYRAEEKMLTVFGYFAGLTILIACLGLFGLASYTAEQRTKEIGIRKVLGGSVTDIILLLSKDFALLVVVAILLASPVAWYGMSKWLEDFAYRTPLNWWIFLIAGISALLIAMLTVSSQAVKAALLNPVKTLRTE